MNLTTGAKARNVKGVEFGGGGNFLTLLPNITAPAMSI